MKKERTFEIPDVLYSVEYLGFTLICVQVELLGDVVRESKDTDLYALGADTEIVHHPGDKVQLLLEVDRSFA